MLDIKLIKNNIEVIKANIIRRGMQADVDKLLDLHHQRQTLMTDLENKRAYANKIAKDIPRARVDEKPSLVEKGRGLNREITLLEQAFNAMDSQYNEAMLEIPNLLADDTPLGTSDEQNVVIRHYSEPRVFDFIPKDHIEIGQSLELIDFDSATKVTGPKFYFLKNQAVLLELALKLFAMKIAAERGYTTLITPDLAKKSVMIGTGFSPRGEESNIYNLEGLDLSLIATAEITVGGMHANEILDESQLPLRYVAESHCFRREAGASGKENKGLYRVHQFSKIELFQITKPEDSEKALEEILALEEAIYQKLELPYRVVRICAGDLGAAAFKKYDIEVWMPGRDSKEKYGEVTSASNCTDFQSRRLNIKYRNQDNQKNYPYTLNGTAIALSRTLMAILENYQQADGSVTIPQVLQSYLGIKNIPLR